MYYHSGNELVYHYEEAIQVIEKINNCAMKFARITI